MTTKESRVKKSLLNARVNLIFYFLTLALSFFSRKIFLNILGADFVGLTGTLQNLLGFLNLAELGIGSAIGYILYKPLYDHNETKINEIISVFGYLYRWIGFIILGVGCLLAGVLPLIFPNTEFDIGIIYFTYFSFLASSLIGYFANYKQTLLGADQKNYIIIASFQTTNIIKVLIQIALVCYTENYYLWVSIELSFGIIYSLILNWKINRVYPWLKSSIKEGKAKLSDNKIIIIKAKQMFVHVLASTGRTQMLPFLIYAFASLKSVAYYGNYMIIIDKINLLINNFLGSTGAGVGNLIAESNKNKIIQVYWELNILRFLIAGFFTFSIFHLIDPFITLWIGKEYLLDKTVRIIITSNLFISLIRGTNEQFNYGYGLFHDTWAPIATLIITIGTALICGYLYGLPGVLIGDIASSISIISVWKPYLLFTQGFHLPVKKYWLQIFKYIIVLIIAWSISSTMLVHIVQPQLLITSYITWIIYSIISSCIFLFFYLTGMLLIDSSHSIGLIKRIIK